MLVRINIKLSWTTPTFNRSLWSSLSSRRLDSFISHALDPFHLFRLETEIKNFQVSLHMGWVGGPGQGNHADIEGESKNNLTDSPTMMFGNPEHFWTVYHIAVGR